MRWRADQRKELEQLCRYITRPAIANARLKGNRAGDIVLQLKSAFKDGTTHIVMEPLEFMERLAALVPRPRLHLIRFHAVLAPNAKLRREIIPSPVAQATEPACDHAHAQGAPARMSWARLLKRVFDIDIEHQAHNAVIDAPGGSHRRTRWELPRRNGHRWRAHISASRLVHLSDCTRSTSWAKSTELAKPAEPSQAVHPGAMCQRARL